MTSDRARAERKQAKHVIVQPHIAIPNTGLALRVSLVWGIGVDGWCCIEDCVCHIHLAFSDST